MPTEQIPEGEKKVNKKDAAFVQCSAVQQ